MPKYEFDRTTKAFVPVQPAPVARPPASGPSPQPIAVAILTETPAAAAWVAAEMAKWPSCLVFCPAASAHAYLQASQPGPRHREVVFHKGTSRDVLEQALLERDLLLLVLGDDLPAWVDVPALTDGMRKGDLVIRSRQRCEETLMSEGSLLETLARGCTIPPPRDNIQMPIVPRSRPLIKPPPVTERLHYPVLDWSWVRSSDMLLQASAPMVSADPVFSPDVNREKLLTMYTSILPGPHGEHYLYYRTHPGSDRHRDLYWLHHCLAISSDGTHWERPDLGYTYEMFDPEHVVHSGTDVVLPGWSEMTVVHDAADAEFPYKALSKEQFFGDRGVRVHRSRDGIHWERGTKNVFPYHCDASDWAFWDRRLGRYVVYVRAFASKLEKSNHPHAHLGRSVGRLEMDDLEEEWPLLSREITLYPFAKCGHPDVASLCETNVPLVLCGDETDAASVDYYESFVDQIDGGYIMLVGTLGNRQPYPTDISLATSQDGVAWKFPVSTPLISNEEVDLGQTLLTVKGRIRVDDIHDAHFFIKINAGHNHISRRDSEGIVHFRDPGAIYMIKHRRGGYFHLCPARRNEWGSVTTQPLTVPPETRDLTLNLDASASGSARVEILDEGGLPVQGLSLQDCPYIFGNGLNKVIRWNHDVAIDRVAGRQVSIRVQLAGARLFGFGFTKEEK